MSSAINSQPLNAAETQILMACMVPQPRNASFTDGPEVIINDRLALTISLATAPEEHRKLVAGLFKEWFGATPALTLQQGSVSDIPAEGYRFESSAAGGLKIAAQGRDGLLNALKTLRQIAEPERGGATLRHYFLPEMRVQDAPVMPFRGVHLCWFPENDVISIEKAIRMAAYYKFNYLVLEPWGIFDYQSHPEFCWQNKKIETATFRRLTRLAREQGLTLIPQLNLFGHASASRNGSGKHVALDFHPEMQPLFEPDGWTWCLSNPVTRQYLTDMALELYDAFEAPLYFHIGCDEAFSMATCLTCRKADYAALLKDHLLHFHDLFAKRGAKIMMWHDMLVVKGDPRWKGYVAMGSATSGAESLLDSLPHDIVICDWQYYILPEEGTTPWPTMQYFHAKGFPVLACPWKDVEGIKSQAQLVREKGMAGMLCTTWNYMHGPDMRNMLHFGANAAWGGGDGKTVRYSTFSKHIRQVGWDIGIKSYPDTGLMQWQVPPENALLN